MKRENVNYATVGMLVIAALALLLYALFRITGQAQQGEDYYACFGNISGIKVGSAVTLDGYELGRVNGIAPAKREGGTCYRLTLKLKPGWTIPADSEARIASSGLLSGQVVEIRQGSSATPLPAGSDIRSQDTTNLFAAMTTLATELTTLTEDGVKPLIANLNRRVDKLGDSLERHVPETMEQLKIMVSRLNSAASALETLLNKENQKHIAGVLENADKTSATMVRVSTEFEHSLKRLDQTLEGTHGIVNENRQDIREAVEDLRDAMARVNTVLHHLEGSSRNMNELSRSLRANPALLIQGKPPADKTEPPEANR